MAGEVPEDLHAKAPAGIRTWYGAEAMFRTQSKTGTVALFRNFSVWRRSCFLPSSETDRSQESPAVMDNEP